MIDEITVVRGRFDDRYAVAQKLQERLLQLWEYRPANVAAQRNARSLRQRLGTLDRCVRIEITPDGVSIVMLRRGCYEMLCKLPAHIDGVSVRIVDPDPTNEEPPEQLSLLTHE